MSEIKVGDIVRPDDPARAGGRWRIPEGVTAGRVTEVDNGLVSADFGGPDGVLTAPAEGWMPVRTEMDMDMQDVENLRDAAAEYKDFRVVGHCNHILSGTAASRDWAAVKAILATGLHKYNGS